MFKARVNIARSANPPPKLQDDNKEPIIDKDPEYYGDLVEMIPPCLDPDKKIKKNSGTDDPYLVRFTETEEMKELREINYESH